MPDHSQNLTASISFIVFSLVYAGLSYFALFQHTARDTQSKILLPLGILLCIGAASYSWSKINFGSQILDGFYQTLFVIVLLLVTLLIMTAIAYKINKYEYFSIPVIILVITGTFLLNKKWNDYRNLDSQKFAERYPDYLNALKGNDLNELDRMITKYKKHDISEVFIVSNITNANTAYFRRLLEQDAISTWSLPRIVDLYSAQKVDIDHSLIKLFIDKDFVDQPILDINVRDLFEKFSKSYLKMKIADIQFFLETVKHHKLNKLLLSSQSNRSGFISDILSHFENYAFNYEKNFDTYKASLEKTIFLLKQLWDSKDFFIVKEEEEKFTFTLNRSKLFIQNEYKNKKNNEEQLNFFKIKIAELENYLKKTKP